jgi:hypothetical protein
MKEERLSSKEKRVVYSIINEVKMTVIHNVLKDIYDYDGRFDSHHVISYDDVLREVMCVELNEQFIEDTIREIKEK